MWACHARKDTETEKVSEIQSCRAENLKGLIQKLKKMASASLVRADLDAQIARSQSREWPRYCRKVSWTKMAQNGRNDHFGQNDLIPNWILACARPKWTKMVHFGPFRSANRTLAMARSQSRRFSNRNKATRFEIADCRVESQPKHLP